jgi:hypothetical protein
LGGLGDQFLEGGEFRGSDFFTRIGKVGGDSVMERSAEKDIQDAAQGGPAGSFLFMGGGINEFASGLAVLEMAFGFQDRQNGPQRWAGRWVFHAVEDFTQGGLIEGKNEIHDFTFTAAEFGRQGHGLKIQPFG